jgi:hypothetical protein
MNVALPRFWIRVEIDRMILDGELPVFTIQCVTCGSFGFADDWPILFRGSDKAEPFCPCCGGVNVERV